MQNHLFIALLLLACVIVVFVDGNSRLLSKPKKGNPNNNNNNIINDINNNDISNNNNINNANTQCVLVTNPAKNLGIPFPTGGAPPGTAISCGVGANYCSAGCCVALNSCTSQCCNQNAQLKCPNTPCQNGGFFCTQQTAVCT